MASSFIKNCGLMLEPQQGVSVDEIVGWAKYAERAGYGYIFRSDHLLAMGEKKGKVASPECWVSLGAVAAQTKKVRFGPMVSPVGFRNPALLARMALTLYSYSQGRLVLSVGAGWYEDEYVAHGIVFPNFVQRNKEFEEALRIVRPLTEGKRVDLDGEYFSAHLECLPKPAKGKVHLVLGGRNTKVVETIARFADEWNIFSSSMETYARLRKVFEESKIRAGRKYEKTEISQMGSFIIGESKREVTRRVARYLRGRAVAPIDTEKETRVLREKGVLCGVVEDFVQQVNEHREAGIEKFYFQILNPEDRAMVDVLTQTLKNEF